MINSNITQRFWWHVRYLGTFHLFNLLNWHLNWNFHWIGLTYIGEARIDKLMYASTVTSCDSVFSLHLFLIPMYSTCSHARYPSPWSSLSRHVTEYSVRMVCSLWTFSWGFRPFILIWFIVWQVYLFLIVCKIKRWCVSIVTCLICGMAVWLQSDCCIDED